MARKYSKAASKTVEGALHKRKKGTLKSGPGGKAGTVKSRKQAIAIGLSEAREKREKVPPRKKGAAKSAAGTSAKSPTRKSAKTSPAKKKAAKKK